MSTCKDLYVSVGNWAGVTKDVRELAFLCKKPRIVVSGRLASGKDTVAELTMRTLGFPDAVGISYASPIREEVNYLLDVVRHETKTESVKIITRYGNIDTNLAQRIADLLYTATQENSGITSYTRTDEIRSTLQIWGTDVRRSQDYDYWAKKAIANVFEHMALDRAIYITDARFVNDIDAARKIGFYAVRLKVESAIRDQRLYARDGLHLNPGAENHPSELNLENYPDFDITVDNSGTLDETIGAVIWQMSYTPAFSGN